MIALGNFFEALADGTRRRILALILKEEELCVCELFFALDVPQPKVSRHLAVLREAGVLSVRKQGTWVFYHIHPELPFWAVKSLEMMAQGLANDPEYLHDHSRLVAMAGRPDRCGE